MSNRLDQEREKKLQPVRMEHACDVLNDLGLNVVKINETALQFLLNGHWITFYAYSGWYTGKGVGSGRGINNIVKKIKQINHE